MKQYDPKKIEPKWQKYWEQHQTFRAEAGSKKPKKYVLAEFPYPSGLGLHMGHLRPYVAGDVYSRYWRLKGFDTLYPMGWDAFGLPAENYAIKQGVHPRVSTAKNIANAKRQTQSWGIGFDWSREINTTDPEYYKWTQWIFLQLYKAGLAYEATGLINWCPKDKTGLANEEVIDGKCDRCGTVVEKKELRQWYLKITAYAEKLLEGLDNLPEWPEPVKLQQANWIGKSVGAEIDFAIQQDNDYILLPGWTSTEKDNFYPWLKENLGPAAAIVKYKPLDGNSETEVLQDLAARVKLTDKTVLVGHSLGGAMALKLLEQSNQKIAKLVLVASFVTPKFKDKARPFETQMNWDFDFEKIKKNVGEIVVLSDETDHVVPESAAVELAEKLGGRLVKFQAQESHVKGKEEPDVLAAVKGSVKVFTTRPDTIFGATYLVVAPEHPLLPSLSDKISNWPEVQGYIEKARNEQEQQRVAEGKDKTGVELKGVVAINPANGQEIPVWIADYVLGNYGTGAIMAVPAHDERDFEFATKFNLPIVQVVAPSIESKDTPPREGKERVERDAVVGILRNPKTGQIACLQWAVSENWKTFITGGVEPGEDPAEACRREITEETGYKNLKLVKKMPLQIHEYFFHLTKDVNRYARFKGFVFELENDEQSPIDEEEKAKHTVVWVDEDKIPEFIQVKAFLSFWDQWKNDGQAFIGHGVLINSGPYDGKESAKVIAKIGAKFGTPKITYKLRDWVFSRQRYWGEPIPLVHCPSCGIVPVLDDQLPVLLPEVEKYEPTGTGESPLAGITEWVNTGCPQCGGAGKRETNTMPQWAGSSWYYLRYTDPDNDKEFASQKLLKNWLPVDVYFGGMEHTTLHLLYSRFWHLALYDQGLVPASEPYTQRVPHGIILASDGEKMSKSVGNVVNPDDIVNQYGADTLRMAELFLGPHEATVAWSEKGIMGVWRFYEWAWKWVNEQNKKPASSDSKTVLRPLHQLIKKVGADIEGFRFNTAVSAFMEFRKQIKSEPVSPEFLKTFLVVLYPFAPHIAEELNEVLSGPGESLQSAAWPKYDPALVENEEWNIVVQVNGKVKDKFIVPANTPQPEIEQKALALPKVADFLAGKQPARVVAVPGKLINIVL
jgi:leucyl-tRNA synthetase